MHSSKVHTYGIIIRYFRMEQGQQIMNNKKTMCVLFFVFCRPNRSWK